MMKKEAKWIQDLEQVAPDYGFGVCPHTVPLCQAESAPTTFFLSHQKPSANYKSKSFCLLPETDYLVWHSSVQSWLKRSKSTLVLQENFKWDKAPKTSAQLCCSSPTQQKNPTILSIMLSDVGNVGISCVKANFYCVKSAFCIQTLFKECPALLCRLEMHYIFYTIVFVSLKPGVYSNLCLPFNWEESKGPVSRLPF